MKQFRNGGYVIVTHDDANIYKKVASAYENGKPILFYDDNNTCFYIDSIAKGVNVYTLVKGGKTFEVTSNNTLSSTGEVGAPTMENIKDLNGNLRFIDGNIDVINANVDEEYNKWSLSGTHLMIVLAGEIAPSTINDTIATLTLPNYIFNKIYPLITTLVDRKTFNFIDEDAVLVSTSISLRKGTENKLQISIDNKTFNKNTNFRIQFDLLIDAE